MKPSKPLKNVASIVFGRSSELILTFFAITILIRYLGVKNYGIFSSVVATVAILSKFIDLGFSQIIFREFSSEKGQKEIINSAISIRLLLFVFLVLLYNSVAFVIHINSREVLISNILFLNIIISAKLRNVRDLLEIPFKSILRMDIVMIAANLDALFLLLFVLIAGFLKSDIIAVSIFYVGANLPGFFILLYFLKKWKTFKFVFTFENIHWLVRESLPLFGAGILSVLFMQLDVVLLKNLISPEQAGFYSAAIRIAIPLSIVPLSIVTTIFPIISANKDKDNLRSRKVVEFSFKVLFLLLFSFSLIVTFKSSEILKLVYGTKFIGAQTSLILLFWAFTFFYSGILFQNLNTILSIQKYNFYYYVILVGVLIFSLFLTLIKLGATGAGLSRVISSLIGFAFLYFILKKSELGFSFFKIKSVLFLLFLMVTAFGLSYLNLFLFAGLFAIVVILSSFLLRFFDTEDVGLLNLLLKEPKWLNRFLK